MPRREGVRRVIEKSSLARGVVGSRARVRYDRGVAVFVEWCRVFTGWNTERQADHVAHLLESGGYFSSAEAKTLDELLSEFYELSYSSDPLDSEAVTPIFARWEASEIHCGITDKCPELKNNLPRAQRSLYAWALSADVVRAPPMHAKLVIAILGFALANNLFSFGAGVLLMFFGLLRPQEFFHLKRRDIQLSSPTIVALWKTKTSRRKNASESASVNDAQAIALLTVFLRPLGPDMFVWSKGPKEFREQFHSVLSRLAIQTPFRLYSLRRGGASRLSTILPMDEVLIRGRWQSAKTARVYIESAVAELLLVQGDNRLVKRYFSVACRLPSA